MWNPPQSQNCMLRTEPMIETTAIKTNGNLNLVGMLGCCISVSTICTYILIR